MCNHLLLLPFPLFQLPMPRLLTNPIECTYKIAQTLLLFTSTGNTQGRATTIWSSLIKIIALHPTSSLCLLPCFKLKPHHGIPLMRISRFPTHWNTQQQLWNQTQSVLHMSPTFDFLFFFLIPFFCAPYYNHASCLDILIILNIFLFREFTLFAPFLLNFTM